MGKGRDRKGQREREGTGEEEEEKTTLTYAMVHFHSLISTNGRTEHCACIHLPTNTHILLPSRNKKCEYYNYIALN
jgi:hypothetical protein